MHSLVSTLQAQPLRSGRDDGRARFVAGTHDDHAMGEALYAGVREALEAFFDTVRALMRADQTYPKICGKWVHRYRAVGRPMSKFSAAR